jgi:hypothetical protein
MSDRTAELNARDDLLELAQRYETVAALDLTPDPGSVGRTPPGSRLPPGMQEILDADEIRTALRGVDEWAEFVAHVTAEECDEVMPDATPARLRAVARHAGHFLDHEDELFALAFADDLREHLHTMRRMSGRGIKRVQTWVRCQVATCKGRYVSPLGATADRTDDALVCDHCGHRIPHVVWSAWPRAKVQYVTVEHAAHMAGTTVEAIRQRAARGKWRRIGTGRDVRYYVDDVRASVSA